ncbi:MAG: hypothetical protein DWQ49_09975 [Bacteroidetes bacterium]|nr:MAG: hypothetical protein DWQ49_09975 [Bacteroidota bacterium]
MADSDDNQQIIPIDDTQNVIERNKLDGWVDLDSKRKAFAMRYIIDYDHRTAAEESGFSPNIAMSLLREPLTAAFISELQKEKGLSNIVTSDFIKTQFVNLIPYLSGQIEVPIVTGSGEQIEARKFYPGELVNVLKELAKSTKFYEDGSSDKGVTNIQINMGDLVGDINV